MITSQEIGELAAAMAKAQAAIENPSKSKENLFFKNEKGVVARYADLAIGLNCIRPALSAQSIAVFQVTKIDRDNNMILLTRLVHSSGQWIESEYFVCKTDLDYQIDTHGLTPEEKVAARKRVMRRAQTIGSALTYARRHSLFAMVGIAGADDDDDGNSASGNGGAAIQNDRFVTSDQLKLLREKIESTGADETRFLEFFKSASIEELRSNEFRTAMNMLNAKKNSRDPV